MSITIYILQCNKNKYYISTVNPVDPAKYFKLKNDVPEWLKIYEPLKVIKLYHNCTAFDEEKYTLQYMAQHGMDNVRGGSFTNTKLSDMDTKIIKKVLSNGPNRCFKCKSDNHYADSCNFNNDDNINTTTPFCTVNFSLPEILTWLFGSTREITECFRCGRNNHYIKDCKALTHISGKRFKTF